MNLSMQLLGLALLGAPPDVAAEFELLLASRTPPVEEKPLVKEAPKESDYARGTRLAMSTHKNLVVFVQMPKREIAGVVTCEHPVGFDNPKVDGPAIVVGAPNPDGYMSLVEILPPNASDARILGREVRQLVTPFQFQRQPQVRQSRSGNC